MNRSWSRLCSGRRIDLINPSPLDWDDEDLAVRMGRVYRWCGDSRWSLPLPVGQHSLLVLNLFRRARKRLGRPITPMEESRELQHDSEEGLLGYDPPTPVKPELGAPFKMMSDRMQRAIFLRYRISFWSQEEHLEHKAADKLAAACEAFHVVGWSREEIRTVLNIRDAPLMEDPLVEIYGGIPWAPWTPDVTAERFLAEMKIIEAKRNLVEKHCELSPVSTKASIGTQQLF